MTSTRWAKEPRRCLHITNRGKFCWQHEKMKGFRITKSRIRPGYGLWTTKEIPANRMICRWSGETFVSKDANLDNPYLLQIKKRPPTFIDASKTNTDEGRWVKSQVRGENNAEFVEQNGKVYLYSLKDIPIQSEITATHKIADIPKPRKPPKVKASIRKPGKPKVPKPKLTLYQKRDARYIKSIVEPLKTILSIFKKKKYADKMGLKFNPNKTITIPAQNDLSRFDYFKILEQKLKKEEQLLLNYINSGAVKTHTLAQVKTLIDDVMKAQKT